MKPSGSFRGARFVAIVLVAVSLLSCARHNSTSQLRAQTSPSEGPVSVGQYGLACRGEGVGPVGYKVSDIGKWGVPNPSAEQLALLAKIRRYDPSKTLRFAFIGHGDYTPIFIVYDNSDHACSLASVLNGSRIEYYQPQQTPYTFSGPAEYATPYPWSSPH